jgi:hypothetical protein
MQTFQHGQEIEVHLLGKWLRDGRRYIGPMLNGRHVYENVGHLCEVSDSNIRPIPAETWKQHTAETVPADHWFRLPSWPADHATRAVWVDGGGVFLFDAWKGKAVAKTYGELLNEGWLTSPDRKSWTRCGIKS